MKSFSRILMSVLFTAGAITVVHAGNDDIAELKKQIVELQEKVVDLEAKLAQSEESSPAVDYYNEGDPFQEIRAMQAQMDALLGAQFGGYLQPGRRAFQVRSPNMTFNPDYDIKEMDKTYVITFDMPGMDKSKINVEVKDGVLLISGERSSESKESQGNKFYRQERSFGYFSRVIPLPKNARADSVQAKYDNGVLTVTVDKKEAVPSKTETKKKIQVK